MTPPRVIDALGWDPEATAEQDGAFEVPLSPGHVQQLHRRRCDLLDTNLDLIEMIGADNKENEPIHAAIYANRDSVEALNHVLDVYSTTITS